ncbi:MAG: anti-FecI sigma factor, FecR [Mucilaginibacter sp.]|nr:anti-FecI sigma factor, FecR [Mucilaginibacter sp.]
MQRTKAQELLQKFQDGNCSEEELALLETWYNQHIITPSKQVTDTEWTEDVYSILKSLDNDNKQQPKVVNWPRIIAAASVVFCLAIGSYFLLNKKVNPQIAQSHLHDIAPGSNKAILTLANGKKIILSGSQNGKLAQQGNAEITKTADGQIVYQAADESAGGAEVVNTTSTPRGGQYHVLLSDGTNVWLNAASSITYPTTFTGNNRTVEITGEVYFEVAHNPAKPFRVKSSNQLVEVLGTHFNINSYADEPASKTTLLEGSVNITVNNHARLLKPGEQAIVAQSNMTIAVTDPDQVIGWKNGDFIFNDEDLQTVMRQVARWYDVDVIYKNTAGYKKFFGTISRTKKLSEILKALEMNQNVHFKIEGRRIEVMP